MFNVSALLLDDALLKFVVTEDVLFSVVAYKTLTFHKVATHSNYLLIVTVTSLKIGQYLTKL